MLCLPSFAKALGDGAFDSIQGAVLLIATFTTYVWFLARYVYLVIADLPEAFSSAIVNVLIVIMGLWAIQLHKSPENWFLAMSFLIFMAMWKDLEAVFRWLKTSQMSDEVRYHQESFLKDLLAAILLVFVHLALKGNMLQPRARGISILAVAIAWFLWTLLCAVIKIRAIINLTSQKKKET